MNSSLEIRVSDPELISDVLNGQKDRFKELIERHQKMVYAIAWSQLGNVELAEEAAQQTFVKAYSSLSSLQDAGKFRSWLATIARNASISLGRLRRRELSNSKRWDIQPVVERSGISEERASLTDELRATVASLPDLHRQVITLFYLEDQSIKHVAETLAISESAVKTRLNRARKMLRRELERRLGDTLSAIAPSHSLVMPVMAALPASAAMSSGSKLALIGKAVIAPVSILTYLGSTLAALIPAWVISSRASVKAAGEIQIGDEHDFRRKIILQRSVIVSLLTLVTLAVVILTDIFAVYTAFYLAAAFSLWGIWLGIRSLRVNSSGLIYALIASMVMWFVGSLAAGIGLMLNWIDGSELGMIPVALAIVIQFLLLYRYRIKTPFRTDYNLFLREATGGLRVDDTNANQMPTEILSRERIVVSTSQLILYAKFLGEHWLITDYDQAADSIRMELPPIRPTLAGYLFKTFRSRSSITLDRLGNCKAFLSEGDRTAIEELTDEMSSNPELVLKFAIENSLQDFLNGDQTSPFKTLCAIEDSEIFAPGAHAAILQRQRRGMVLVVSGAVFLMLLWPATDWLATLFNLR